MVSVHNGMWADCMLTRVAPVLVMRRAYACMFIDGHVHITVTMWSSISRPYAQSAGLWPASTPKMLATQNGLDTPHRRCRCHRGVVASNWHLPVCHPTMPRGEGGEDETSTEDLD